MPADSEPDTHLEIGHVLFMDVVGYSKLLLDEQRELQQELTQIVRNTEQVRAAETAGKLIRVPTGDGMALVFFNSPEAPVRCAVEISEKLKHHPELKLRTGIHSGPVNEVRDVNDRVNVAGAGINIAQRVMECGAGHILLSKRVAEDLAQSRKWQPYLHDLGECAVKHNVPVFIVNFYNDEVGNPELPEKFKQTREEKAPVFAARRPAPILRRRRVLIGAGVLLIAAFVLGIWFHSRNATTRGLDAEIRSRVAESLKAKLGAEIRSRVVESLEGKVATSPPEKSIAVLPFENLSRDPDNAFFAEGVQDEILTRLAKVADLKVIARTSTQKFKSAPDNLRQVAKQLGVMNIVEGSVQKVSDQIRVNVQLINAMTDAQLWAETYDRELTDIFAVESDIAKTITDMLQAKLTGSEQRMIASQATSDTTAYELYHKGRSFWERRSGDNIPRAILFYEQAIARDPKYALAYAGLANSYVLLPFFTPTLRRDASLKAKEAALKAVQLDPNLAEAHAALGEVLYFNELDLAGALREFERAIELKPNYATAHHWYGNGPLLGLGRFEEAIAESRRAVDLDPLSPIINADLGGTLSIARRYDHAVAQLQKTLELDPTFFYTRYHLGVALQLKGDLPSAIAEFEKAKQLNGDAVVLALGGAAKALAGDKSAALQTLIDLDKLSQHREVPAFYRSLLYLSLNNKEEALRWLEQSVADRDGGNVGWIKVDPLLDPLRGDPRFEALVQKVVGPERK